MFFSFRKKKGAISKCNFCGETYQTGKKYETYVCPECEELLAVGRLGHEKTVLMRHWQRKGLMP